MSTPDMTPITMLLNQVITRSKKLATYFKLKQATDSDAGRMFKYVAGQLAFMEADKDNYRPREREWMGDINHILYDLKQLYSYIESFKSTMSDPVKVSQDPEPPEVSKSTEASQPAETSELPKSNSYNDFFKIVHPMIKANNPTWSPQEITTEIGRQWSIIKVGQQEPNTGTGKVEVTSKRNKKASSPTSNKEEQQSIQTESVPVKTEEPAGDTKKKAGRSKKITEKPEEAVKVEASIEESSVKVEETPKKAGRAKKNKEEAPESPKEATTADSQEEPLHVKRKKIPKAIRTLVWNKYIGADITAAKCLCCREEKISHTNWHCGHVHSEAKGGDTTINNLRPICAPCNSSMGTKSMNEFMEEYFGRTL